MLRAFVLFALAPAQIYYAQEGRSYALLTLLVLLAWYLIINRSWPALVITITALLYCHNYGLIYSAALWLAGILVHNKQWKVLTICFISAGCLFIPWVYILFQQMAAIDSNYWMVHLTPASLMDDLTNSYYSTAGSLFSGLFNVAVFWGCLGWAVFHGIKNKQVIRSVYILAFIPIILAVIVSLAWQPIILSRALIPSGTFIIIILSQPAAWTLAQPRRLLLAAIFFMPALLVNLIYTTNRIHTPSEAENSALIFLSERWQPTDTLYYTDDGVFVASVGRQLLDPARMTRSIPCGPVLGGLTLSTRHAIGERQGQPPTNPPGRLWVISVQTPLTPACEYTNLFNHGLIKSKPVYCYRNDILVKACIYLIP